MKILSIDGLKSYKDMSEYEKWTTKFTLKELANSPKELEENVGQKLALALKRSSIMLNDIVQISNTRIAHSKSTMISIVKSIFDTTPPQSAGYPEEVREDI